MIKAARIRQNSDDSLTRQIDFISSLFSGSYLCKEYLSFLVENLKISTRCECVGIRVLKENGVMPYEAFAGFTFEFWEHENLLSTNTDQCGCIRVATGQPDALDRQILTLNGSLWTNDLQGFGSSIPAEECGRYRGKCIECGFQSLAVVPVRHAETIIGLIHLADSRKNMLPLETMALLESASGAIGATIVRLIGSQKTTMEKR